MLPIEFLKGDGSTNVEALLKFLERTQEIWRQARVQMEKAMVKQKSYYDKKHWYTQLSVKDLTLLST